MSPTTSQTPRIDLRSSGCDADRARSSKRRAEVSRSSRRRRVACDARPALARYENDCGRAREIIAIAGAGASVLVLDRDAVTLGDRRLLAHLAPDEPPENAALVCRSFLRRLQRGDCRCRLLSSADLCSVPYVDGADQEELRSTAASPDALRDRFGFEHRIERVAGDMSIPQLRWCRSAESGPRPQSVRETVARLERYEPVIGLTKHALALHSSDDTVSTAVLRAELARLQESPIVLNRALRAAAVGAIGRGQSMSEIAMRCGRIKRDATGNESGETSWLARRLGLLPEGGRRDLTPWIHSDVLALIARDGLGLSPREVEAD